WDHPNAAAAWSKQRIKPRTRIGQAFDRLPLRVVDATKLNRNHAEGDRELVDRAFQREEIGRLWGRPHEARRIAICAYDVDARPHVVACVKSRGRGRSGHIIGRRPRRDLPAFMGDNLQLAIASIYGSSCCLSRLAAASTVAPALSNVADGVSS